MILLLLFSTAWEASKLWQLLTRNHTFLLPLLPPPRRRFKKKQKKSYPHSNNSLAPLLPKINYIHFHFRCMFSCLDKKSSSYIYLHWDISWDISYSYYQRWDYCMNNMELRATVAYYNCETFLKNTSIAPRTSSVAILSIASPVPPPFSLSISHQLSNWQRIFGSTPARNYRASFGLVSTAAQSLARTDHLGSGPSAEN